jgi:hypothetical protein
MKDHRVHTIEIDRLVLTGAPQRAAIEAAVLRALRGSGIEGAVGVPDAQPAIANEVARSVSQTVRGGGGR